MHRLCLLAVLALFALAAPAYAQDAPIDTYGGAGGVLDETTQDDGGGVAGEETGGDNGGGVRGETVDDDQGGVRGVTTDAGARDGGGTLPFTGADLTLMLLGGLALLGVGIGVRQLSRTPA